MFKKNLFFILLILVISIVAFKVHGSFKESVDVSGVDVSNNEIPKEVLDKYYSLTKLRSDGKRQIIFPNTCYNLRQYTQYPDLCTKTYGRAGTKYCRLDHTNKCEPPR